MTIPDEILTELRAKHPRGVKVFSLSDGRAFAFQAASADHFRSHKADMLQIVTNPAVAATAGERLAEELCVWPSREDFRRLRDEAPGVAGRIGDQMAEMAGGGITLVEGKADAWR